MRDHALRAGTWILLLPFLLVLGVRIGWLMAVVSGLLVACFGTAVAFYLKGITNRYARMTLFLLVMSTGVGLTGVLGPLVFVPGFVAVNTLLFTAQAPPRHRWIMVAV